MSIRWVGCHNCNRGGNGNDKDKCSCGWQITDDKGLGCYLGSDIIGEIKPIKKLSRGKERYRRYLEYSDCFDSFIEFCRWDAQQLKELDKCR